MYRKAHGNFRCGFYRPWSLIPHIYFKGLKIHCKSKENKIALGKQKLKYFEREFMEAIENGWHLKVFRQNYFHSTIQDFYCPFCVQLLYAYFTLILTAITQGFTFILLTAVTHRLHFNSVHNYHPRRHCTFIHHLTHCFHTSRLTFYPPHSFTTTHHGYTFTHPTAYTHTLTSCTYMYFIQAISFAYRSPDYYTYLWKLAHASTLFTLK